MTSQFIHEIAPINWGLGSSDPSSISAQSRLYDVILCVNKTDPHVEGRGLSRILGQETVKIV